MTVFHSPAGFSYSRNVLFPLSMKPPSGQRGHMGHFWACWLSSIAKVSSFVWELLRASLCLSCQSPVEIFLSSLPFWAASVWLSRAKCRRGLQCTFVWFCWPDWALVLFSFRISSGCLTSVVLSWSCDHFFLKEEVRPCYLLEICWRSAGDLPEICWRSSNFSNTHIKDWTPLIYNAIDSLTPHLSKPYPMFSRAVI